MPSIPHHQAVLGILLTLSTPLIQAEEAEKPLSQEALAYTAERLRALDNRFQSRPSIEVLSQYGIGKDNDLYERNEKYGHIPPSVGYAPEMGSTKSPLDPMLSLGMYASLRAELEYQPAPSEVAAKVAEFDARIRALNAGLAERRDTIAGHYNETGRPPADLITQLAAAQFNPRAAPYPYELPSAKERAAGDWSIFKGLLEYLATGR